MEVGYSITEMKAKVKQRTGRTVTKRVLKGALEHMWLSERLMGNKRECT